MINSTNAREPVREILVSGVAGGVLGRIVTLALAIGFAGSFVFAAVMAMQGALTGAMGMGWAVAMVLAHTEDEPVMEARDIAAAPIQPTKGWPVNNFSILIDVLVRFFTPKVFHSIAQGRRAAAHPG
jgi:hypothetical protein